MHTMLQDSDAVKREPATGASNGDLSCMGTGMDVACSYDENGQPKAKQINTETLQAAAGVPSLIFTSHVQTNAINRRLRCVVPENPQYAGALSMSLPTHSVRQQEPYRDSMA